MAKGKNKGWPNEPARHSLAAKGIKTGRKKTITTRPMPKVGMKKDRGYSGPMFYSETEWMSGSRGLRRRTYYHKEIGWYGPRYTDVLMLRVWAKPDGWHYESRDKHGALMSIGDKKTKKEAFEAVEYSSHLMLRV